MPEPTAPIFLDGRRIGLVHDVVSYGGFFRGRLVLEDAAPQFFGAIVAFAAVVDTCSLNDYRAGWQEWARACGEVQSLQLRIGDAETPVLEFTIDSDWSIQWRSADSEYRGA